MKKSAKTNGWGRRWFVLNEKTGKVSVYHKYSSGVHPNICKREALCTLIVTVMLAVYFPLQFCFLFLEDLFIIVIEVICHCIFLSPAWLYEETRRKKLPRHCNFGGIILLKYLLFFLVEVKDVTAIKIVMIYVALPSRVMITCNCEAYTAKRFITITADEKTRMFHNNI